MVNVITFLGPILVTLSAYFWMASNWKKGKLSSEIFIHRCRWLKGLLPISSVILGPVIWYFKDSMNSFIVPLSVGLLASLFIAELMTSYYRRQVMGVGLFKRTELKKVANSFIIASPVVILIFCIVCLSEFYPNVEWFKSPFMNYCFNVIGFWLIWGFGLSFGLIVINQKTRFPNKEVSKVKETQIKETFLKCGYSSIEIVCVDDEVLRYQWCSSFLGKKGLRITISDTLLHRLTSERLKR